MSSPPTDCPTSGSWSCMNAAAQFGIVFAALCGAGVIGYAYYIAYIRPQLRRKRQHALAMPNNPQVPIDEVLQLPRRNSRDITVGRGADGRITIDISGRDSPSPTFSVCGTPKGPQGPTSRGTNTGPWPPPPGPPPPMQPGLPVAASMPILPPPTVLPGGLGTWPLPPHYVQPAVPLGAPPPPPPMTQMIPPSFGPPPGPLLPPFQDYSTPGWFNQPPPGPPPSGPAPAPPHPSDPQPNDWPNARRQPSRRGSFQRNKTSSPPLRRTSLRRPHSDFASTRNPRFPRSGYASAVTDSSSSDSRRRKRKSRSIFSRSPNPRPRDFYVSESSDTPAGKRRSKIITTKKVAFVYPPGTYSPRPESRVGNRQRSASPPLQRVKTGNVGGDGRSSMRSRWFPPSGTVESRVGRARNSGSDEGSTRPRRGVRSPSPSPTVSYVRRRGVSPISPSLRAGVMTRRTTAPVTLSDNYYDTSSPPTTPLHNPDHPPVPDPPSPSASPSPPPRSSTARYTSTDEPRGWNRYSTFSTSSARPASSSMVQIVRARPSLEDPGPPPPPSSSRQPRPRDEGGVGRHSRDVSLSSTGAACGREDWNRDGRKGKLVRWTQRRLSSGSSGARGRSGDEER